MSDEAMNRLNVWRFAMTTAAVGASLTALSGMAMVGVVPWAAQLPSALGPLLLLVGCWVAVAAGEEQRGEDGF